MFSHVGAFPGLNRYLIEYNVFSTRKQHGASRETKTNDTYLKSNTIPRVDATGNYRFLKKSFMSACLLG